MILHGQRRKKNILVHTQESTQTGAVRCTNKSRFPGMEGPHTNKGSCYVCDLVVFYLPKHVQGS